MHFRNCTPHSRAHVKYYYLCVQHTQSILHIFLRLFCFLFVSFALVDVLRASNLMWIEYSSQRQICTVALPNTFGIYLSASWKALQQRHWNGQIKTPPKKWCVCAIDRINKFSTTYIEIDACIGLKQQISNSDISKIEQTCHVQYCLGVLSTVICFFSACLRSSVDFDCVPLTGVYLSCIRKCCIDWTTTSKSWCDVCVVMRVPTFAWNSTHFCRANCLLHTIFGVIYSAIYTKWRRLKHFKHITNKYPQWVNYFTKRSIDAYQFHCEMRIANPKPISMKVDTPLYGYIVKRQRHWFHWDGKNPFMKLVSVFANTKRVLLLLLLSLFSVFMNEYWTKIMSWTKNCKRKLCGACTFICIACINQLIHTHAYTWLCVFLFPIP